jgi:hypothetical protein
MALDSNLAFLGLSVLGYTAANASGFPRCNNESLSAPTILGTEIINIQAAPVTDFSTKSVAMAAWTKSEFHGLDFCNVTVQYAHPGYDDSVTVTLLLPQEDTWNGNFMGVGGGGWSATMGNLMTIPGVDAGYSVATTNAGVLTNGFSSAGWALLSPGNPDIGRLDIFASRALHEMTVIGKSVTEQYYAQAAAYAYWVGCSQGGRQGLMSAQRYPEDYNGIAALAPAVNWGQFFPAMHWAHQVMHELDYYPSPCEVNAFMAAAVEACDELDGIADGVISSDECAFNPFALVGQTFDCGGTDTAFTKNGASVMEAAWEGPRSADGEF